ncbi:MAG TPA: flagellar export protein FliJ [Geobacteraceae bacterium]|nr:flagellar export protein FliJ [Geobacteraceae bacterium]
MRKKGFKLDTVLNYRKEVEKVRRLEYAEAKQELDMASVRLKCEEEEVERLNSEFVNRQQQGITGLDLQLYAVFFRKKSTDIRNQRRNVSILHNEVRERQETLIDAAKGKKILESLEKKSSLAQKRDQADKEKAFLEEIALRNRRTNKL